MIFKLLCPQNLILTACAKMEMDSINYWLMKSEPDVYGITDLQRQQKTIWDGVRNYQARNFLRQMQPGDFSFFYHSNTKFPGIVGLMRVIEANIVDPTQFDTQSPYYDPKSKPDAPRWQTVMVEFVDIFTQSIELSTLKDKFSGEDLILVRKGNRLSVIPIDIWVAQEILRMKS